MEKKVNTNRLILLAVFLLLGLVLGLQTQALAQVTCFPTCEHDGRFLVLSGTGLETLAGDRINFKVSAPASAETVTISIFDGETSQNWDRGSVQMVYTLYADPTGNGTGAIQLGQWTGAVMFNNEWFDITFDPRVGDYTLGRSLSLNYFYRLEVTNPNPTVYALNAFKIMTTGQVTMSPQAFAYIVPVAQPGSIYFTQDFQWIYPDLVAVYPWEPQSETRYNGEFDFYLYVPESSPYLSVWDGDMDFGNLVLPPTGDPFVSDQDDDDPDTPNAPFMPPWSTGTQATSEAMAFGFSFNGLTITGNPADDSWDPPYLRSPSVNYVITDPGGAIFENLNPSGNREWEQFRIDTNPANPADHYVGAELPSGLYHVHLSGLDIFNLNAFRFMYDAVGVCEENKTNPCKPLLLPYLIGDTVWIDTIIRDGVQNDGEPGRAGVVVYLLDSNDNPVNDVFGNPISATTNSVGYYEFQVQGRKTVVDPLTGLEIEYFNGEYKVRVGAENFDCTPGSVGALCGLTSTILPVNPDASEGGNAITHTVNNSNVMSYDFGYSSGLGGDGSVTIGDFVWWDKNSNGLQDDDEPGIADVTLTLQIDINANGSYDQVLPAMTAADGSYFFDKLYTGSNYIVTVDASNFASGGPLYGFLATDSLAGGDPMVDSNGSPASVSFPADGSLLEDLTIDFGFKVTENTSAGIGDFVWRDMNVDGIQDADEPGIAGVLVELRSTGGALLRTTTTDADGYYYFGGLAPGSYIVKVAASNFLAGGVLVAWYASPQFQGGNPELDSNGDASTHQASVTVAAYEDDLSIDFGFYRTCIAFEKTGPDVVDAGEPITYHFRVENCGDLVLHGGVSVYDAMLNPSGDHQIWHEVVWPGEVWTFDKTYTPKAGVCGNLSNTATAVGHPQRPDGSYAPNVTAKSTWVVEILCTQAYEGCTPGYWKQTQHFDSWMGYVPTGKYATNYKGIFHVSYDMTLLQALGKGGGGKEALGRHSAAALLNASNPGVYYPYTDDEIIAMVQAAFTSKNYEDAKNILAAANEKFCPLN